MRNIKIFFFGLLVLAILFTLFSLFIPSTVRVSRVVEIDAPAEKIYTAVSNVNTWNNWMPWSAADSLFKINVNITGEKIKSSYSWQVKKDDSKKGKITVVELHNDEIVMLNELSGYKASPGSFKLYTNPHAAYVLVEWKIKIGIKWYPWAKLKGILLDKIYGPVLEDGLKRLKAYCEGTK
ncbi:MAG TPA: SRPBCC family protein [Chitinophagaceae bacterium]|nr:SRPBCC family protein [Chitinophagaceae bacterium]